MTPHQCKYIAHLLRYPGREGVDRLSQALFDASVDLNPHQIEAALFALHSPLSKGVMLADEVGLGKTIEAGIVLCQYWAEKKRSLLVIGPASLRKQWALELEEKFNLPTLVLDARSWKQAVKEGRNPLMDQKIVIMSFSYANRMREELKAIAWDLTVLDEAHKLRNAYRPSNKMGQGIRWATEGCRKLLLTATPLQNSLMELYGLSTLIDEHLFGDVNSFRSQYTGLGSDPEDLRKRLAGFCKRTLRNQVSEYIKYTERRPLTVPFTPRDDEQRFYEAVSDFLNRPDSYAIPARQRHLTILILRKLLASSTHAISGTLQGMKLRLEALRDDKLDSDDGEALAQWVVDEEMEEDLLEEILDGDLEGDADEEASEPLLDRKRLKDEIQELNHLIQWAESMGEDTKTAALLQALEAGFENMQGMGAERKAIVFTESRRTQEYLCGYLNKQGYAGKVVAFNGSNNGEQAAGIYRDWLEAHQGSSRVAGSRPVDIRTALIDFFRDKGEIFIATEAAAEGVNLQFCSLVINYDLPWNPQRIEQRIGRCHRYGQKHDVVVINFLNQRNDADRRVLELLTEKFKLFDGVFGASDDVLGSIESGVDFEKRILAIYEQCRTPDEIEVAFKSLQKELDDQIQTRMAETRQALLEHFDEDVHQRLRLRLADAKSRLDQFGRMFWELTRTLLKDHADFDEEQLSFKLNAAPMPSASLGLYHLISKQSPDAVKEDPHAQLYRLSHPLGEYVVETGCDLETPKNELVFDVSNHPTRLLQVEALKGKRGLLTLGHLRVESFEREDYLLFSGTVEGEGALDPETADKMMRCGVREHKPCEITGPERDRLTAELQRHAKATLSKSLETNSEHFQVAREKLEQWADDCVLAAEKTLNDTKEQIKAIRRQSRQATSLDEQHDLQQKLQQLERAQRRQRQEIFRVEDEIMEKRDLLVDELEKRMTRDSQLETLFSIHWRVV
jgi:hypothetical protein